jgi:cyanophycinase-like exopeptidase
MQPIFIQLTISTIRQEELMKLTKGLGSIIALLLATSQIAAADTNKMPEFSLMLMGGAVNLCGSAQPSQCVTKANVENASSGRQFMIEDRFVEIIGKSVIWQGDRADVGAQLQAMLKFLQKKLAGSVVSERELTRLFRSSEVEFKGQFMSGRELYGRLTELERDFLLDQLEVMAARGKSEVRLKVKADPLQSRDQQSLKLMQDFVGQAQKISGKRKPRIMLITAAARDPYASVDFYLETFGALGAEASFLPINAAYQAAKRSPVGLDVACKDFLTHLTKEQPVYQRGRVYPDLIEQQRQMCRLGINRVLDEIKQTDAIFIDGDDAELARKAFLNPDGSDTEELALIRSMFVRGKVVIASSQAASAAMVGGSFDNKSTPMLTGGDSQTALLEGAVDATNANPDQLTFNGKGGLAFFSYGVVDTQFSEKARHGRLLRLVLQQGLRFGFGIDDGTALLVGFDKPNQLADARFSVSGKGGVFVAETNADTRFSAPVMQNVQSHYFTSGDRFNLIKGALLADFADWKFAPSNAQKPLLSSGDLFERDNYRKLANFLCLTQSREAVGQFVLAGQNYRLTLKRDQNSAARAGQMLVGNQELQYCSYRNFAIQVEQAQ